MGRVLDAVDGTTLLMGWILYYNTQGRIGPSKKGRQISGTRSAALMDATTPRSVSRWFGGAAASAAANSAFRLARCVLRGVRGAAAQGCGRVLQLPAHLDP